VIAKARVKQRQKLEGLVSHRHDFDQEMLESFLQMASLIGSVLGPGNCPPAKELIGLFCANSCNSFSITNEEGLEIGVGLFPQLSMMNHSCSPNAILYFNQTQAQVTALRRIEKGEEICISYVDLTLGKNDRRNILRTQYFFDCSCPCCFSKVSPFFLEKIGGS
jgi:SET and MYND domain-containing protein